MKQTNEKNNEAKTGDDMEEETVNIDIKREDMSSERMTATKENELSQITTFEDLMDIVGTGGRWNLLLSILFSYSEYCHHMMGGNEIGREET